MGIKYTKEQRESIIKQSIGKKIIRLRYDKGVDYWIMTFTDGTEMSFRFMAELV